MNRLFNRERRGFTYIELLIVVALLGILAAIAVPNFLKFQTRARQAEAKANLTAWYTAERAYYLEENTYTESVLDVGFSPELGNRYAYRFGWSSNCVTRTAAGESAVLPQDTCITVDTGAHPGAAPTPALYFPQSIVFSGPGFYTIPGMGSCSGSSCHITALASGNIDNETTGIDTWFISTRDGQSFTAACGDDGTASAAGTPLLFYDDVTCGN